MRRFIGALASVLGLLAGALLLFLVVGISFDVAQRALTGRGIPEIAEYADIVLVGLVYLGLARTQAEGGHVASDLVAVRLSPRLRFALEFAGLAVVLVLLAGVTWYAFEDAIESYLRDEYRLGLAEARIWPARWAIVVGLIAWQLQLFLRLADLVSAFRSGRESSTEAARTLSNI